MKGWVVLPTYNEKDNLAPLIRQILRIDPSLTIVVVDDGSPDGTGRLAARLAARDRRLRVIRRPGKMGLGTAYQAGFRMALEQGATHVLTMDADFSHDPKYIPVLFTRVRQPGTGMVIGSRYVYNGGTLNWGLKRQFISSGGNLAARWMLGLPAHDCTSGFRCYRRETLSSIDYDLINSSGYSFLVEVLFRCAERGIRSAEVPIIFTDRTMGTSKISRSEIFKSIATLFRLRFYKLFGFS